MKINETFTCPHCAEGGPSRIISAGSLLSDTLMLKFVCGACGAEWDSYYKVSEMNTVLYHVPQKEESTTEEETKE